LSPTSLITAFSNARREAGSEFIITEDRALLRVKEHAGAKLVRAADFLAAGLRR
jgi:hypothetical protein